MKFGSKKTRIYLACLGLPVILAVLGYGAYLAYQSSKAIHNAYAVWWVADMVIEHMESNDGQWPTGWDDLREPFENCVKIVGNRPWTFEDLRNRAEVDWQADPRSLAKSATKDRKPTFRVIWLRDGTDSHWESKEPNQMVYEYLSQSHKVRDEPPNGT